MCVWLFVRAIAENRVDQNRINKFDWITFWLLWKLADIKIRSRISSFPMNRSNRLSGIDIESESCLLLSRYTWWSSLFFYLSCLPNQSFENISVEWLKCNPRSQEHWTLLAKICSWSHCMLNPNWEEKKTRKERFTDNLNSNVWLLFHHNHFCGIYSWLQRHGPWYFVLNPDAKWRTGWSHWKQLRCVNIMRPA